MGKSITRTKVLDFASTPTDVSTLTPLTPWLSMSPFSHCLFSLLNLDGVENVYLRIETSEDADHADSDEVRDVLVPAGKQGSVNVEDNNRAYYRLSAYSTGPGFPTVQVKYAVTGIWES